MRKGTNPMRADRVAGYKPIIASAIVYLPNDEGYHAERFEVVKCSLETMRNNAGVEVGTHVWVNAGTKEFKDWLLDEYKPDVVTFSDNVGKATARYGIVRSLPDNVIIGVADDDIFYYPGWMKSQIELLKVFPNVGQVSGYPVRTQFRWGNVNTKRWAQRTAMIEYGKFIPEQYDRDFCTSIGRDYAYQVDYTREDNDVLITFQGHKAYGVAHHCQWIGYSHVMKNLVIADRDAMGDEKPFDWAVDNSGLLRLTTTQRYTRHIGNVLDDELRELWQGKRKRKH